MEKTFGTGPYRTTNLESDIDNGEMQLNEERNDFPLRSKLRVRTLQRNKLTD